MFARVHRALGFSSVLEGRVFVGANRVLDSSVMYRKSHSCRCFPVSIGRWVFQLCRKVLFAFSFGKSTLSLLSCRQFITHEGVDVCGPGLLSLSFFFFQLLPLFLSLSPFGAQHHQLYRPLTRYSTPHIAFPGKFIAHPTTAIFLTNEFSFTYCSYIFCMHRRRLHHSREFRRLDIRYGIIGGVGWLQILLTSFYLL